MVTGTNALFSDSQEGLLHILSVFPAQLRSGFHYRYHKESTANSIAFEKESTARTRHVNMSYFSKILMESSGKTAKHLVFLLKELKVKTIKFMDASFHSFWKITKEKHF